MAAQAVKRLIPLFDRVLVQKAELAKQTKSGILLPENQSKKVLHGTVIAVGPGSRNVKGEFVPVSIQVGDKVLLPEYGGTKVEFVDDQEYHLYKESEILAKVDA